MFEYILLLISFILPIWYRYFFWFSSFEKHRWFNYSRDKNNIFHLFFLIELILLIFSLIIFINKPFEFIIYNIVFYYWVMSSVFVLWKILRWKLKNQIKNTRKYYVFLLLFSIILFISIWCIYYTNIYFWFYTYLLWISILSPIITFIIIHIFFKKIIMKKVAILTWWPWMEREIALKSASFFKKYLNREFDVYDLPNQMYLFLKHKDEYEYVIPVFHWEYWEDGKIFAFLDTLNIPHTFSDYKTHALCLDKEKTNTLVYQLWVKVPFQYIAKDNQSFPESYPVIMKPNQWWSSFHTYKIENNQEFYDCFNKTRNDLSDDILIQEFIAWEEYSVPLVHWEVLPIMKVEKDVNLLFDYESKYESEEKMKETFPEIEEWLLKKLQDDSVKIYNYFNIKWMSRIDFLVMNNNVYFLEINTIPWMTEASILPKAWNLTWKNNTELVRLLTKIK